MFLFLPFSQLVKVLKFYIHYFFKHGRFPSPFKTGFFRQAIEQGTPALVCLVDPKVFARHFIHAEDDHIHFLLETQKRMERPIYIVPQLILYKKTPEKEHSGLLDVFFGFKENPGVVRKIGLFFRHHRRAFIDFARPLNLKTYLEHQPVSRPMEELATEIRQMLIDGIDMQKRVILGPVMSSRQQQKEKVLKDAEIIAVIEQTAGGDVKKSKQLRKKAGEYFDEIAADYNIAYIQFFHLALRWFWKKIFEGIVVDHENLTVAREWSRRGPVVFVPSHKSHIDYLVLNYVLFAHHMHIPRIAAGKNLAFWPMGHIFRKAGAFFIRRTFKGARLYAKVFTRYIKALLEEGHPLEFYIEGGRSRSGKLIIPKMGFLSILIEAYEQGYCNDLVFLPASISYDRVIEEKAYLKELGGDEKKQESFGQVFRARRFLKRRYGKIYVQFGKPLSLKQYQADNADLGQRMQRELAFHLIKSINRATLVTPLSLVASAILTMHRRGFHLHELTATAEILLGFLQTYQIPMATTLNLLETSIEETLSLLVNRKVVNFLEDVNGAEIFYYVDDDKKRELEYYKNSIIHCFISHAFVAVSLLTGTEETKSEDSICEDYAFLKHLFKNEFVYDDGQNIREGSNAAIAYFLEVAYINRSKSNGGCELTRLGFNRLPLWAALAKTFLESYWIAVRSFIQRKRSPRKRGDILKTMNYMGLSFHKMGLIDHIEAVSQVNFSNAIQFINEEILRTKNENEPDPQQSHKRLIRLSERLYDLSHFRV
jgi:glycerol-3-phosphate O-acyltransferase